MVLRIHPAPLHYGNKRASSPTAVGTSQHAVEIWIPAPSPSNSPVGRSQLLAGRRQVPRWLKSLEDMSPLPFLAFSIVGELFCIVSNLSYLGLCLSFVWAEMFGNSSCQSHGGSAAAFHGGAVTTALLRLLLSLRDPLRFQLLPARPGWRMDTAALPGVQLAWYPLQREGNEQAVSLEVGWGQWHVLGSNGR